ncbi:MAG: DUF4912 domain-containing protein [Methylobacter sp.]|nr:DUF4912 domain-containing protein [Methylobacter sp.]
MQSIEILLNKFLILKVIYLTIDGNGLKLGMILSPSSHISQDKLSRRDILEISQEISRNYAPVASENPPEFTAKIRLSPIEILEISEEISRNYTLKISTAMPELVLLPVGPEHLHAYWNPGQAGIISAPKDDSHEVVLRIYSQPDESSTATTKSWFDIIINNSRTQQKVVLPPQAKSSAYSAAIGKRSPDDRLAAFATSNVIHIPRSSVAPYQGGEVTVIPEAMPQVVLSGQGQSHYTSKNASGQSK